MHRFPAADPAAPPGAMLPAPFRVADKRQDTHDTWTLTLEPVDADLPAFAPGQFAMLYAHGVGEVPISLSAAPHVHTIRAVGAVTQTLCRSEPGDVIGVRGPFGTPWPLDACAGRDVVIAAGGIGLAPLRPAIHAALRAARRVAVIYGARGPDELLYRDELGDWDAAVTVDAAGSDWRGRVGLVTTLVPPLDIDSSEAVAFVVGPEVMMRFTVQALRDHGISSDRIWISMERNMQCGVGHCGHCQLGPLFICKDGPVLRQDRIEPWLGVREL